MQRLGASLCSVAEDVVSDMFPDTPLQEGLLAMTVKRAGDYVAHFVLDLKRQTSTVQLQRTWATVLQKNSIMRTRIIDVPGQGLTQVIINEQQEWNFYTDIEACRNDQRDMGLEVALYRPSLIERDSSGQRISVVTIHHALYDSWSFPPLMDLQSAYEDDTCEALTPMESFVIYMSRQDQVCTDEFRELAAGRHNCGLAPISSIIDIPIKDDCMYHSKDRQHTLE